MLRVLPPSIPVLLENPDHRVFARGANEKFALLLEGKLRAQSGTEKGEAATRRMYRLVASQTLTCHLNGRTSYDRKIGSCQLASGTDVGSVMIREGYCSRYLRSPKRRRPGMFK